jgi:hypothetical protein
MQQNTVLSVAQSLQRRHDDRHIKEVQPSEILELTDGSHVVVKPHDNPLSGRRPATKFDLKWAGPYEIVSHSGNVQTQGLGSGRYVYRPPHEGQPQAVSF